MNPEKKLEKAIIQYLECKGWYAVKVHSGKLLTSYNGRTGAVQLAPEGTPDIHCCIDGFAIYIEVKADEGKARAWERQVERYVANGHAPKSARRAIMQHECQQRIIRSGGKVIICGSIAELERDLINLGFIHSPHSHVRAQKHIPVPRQETQGGEKENGKRSRQGGGRTRRKIPVFIEAASEAAKAVCKILEETGEYEIKVRAIASNENDG